MQVPQHLYLRVVCRVSEVFLVIDFFFLRALLSVLLHLVMQIELDVLILAVLLWGWCMFLGDSQVSWKSKKQARVSKSSTESKYCTMSATCSKIVWLRGLLAKLCFPQFDPTPIHADNTSDIQIAADPVYHERNLSKRIVIPLERLLTLIFFIFCISLLTFRLLMYSLKQLLINAISFL